MFDAPAGAEDQLPRIRTAINRLTQAVWSSAGPVEVEAAPPTREPVSLEAAADLEYRPIAALPEFWGKMFDQRWFRVRLPAPSRAGDWLRWHGHGETIVYHDGVARGGADASRDSVRLPEGATELLVECIAENLGIVTPRGEDLDRHGCRFDGADLARRDDDAFRCMVDLTVVRDVIEIERRSVDGPAPIEGPHNGVLWGPRRPQTHATPRMRALLARTADAIDAFDHDGPAAMLGVLDALFGEFAGGDPHIEALLTGHAHLDLVWRWPLRTSKFKAVHTASNVLGLMDLDDSFRFNASQPLMMRWIEARQPEVAERIRARTTEGRWEPIGALLVESDVQLPCGEGLVRSALLGQRAFERERGEPSKLLWLPDCFGFSGCLPQIAREVGVEHFFTTKVHWSSGQRFPYSAFRWRGVDGSELLAFVPGDFHYNGEGSAMEIRQAALQQGQSHVVPATLVPTGLGDGAGGPTEEILRRVERLRSFAGMPRTRWARTDEFYAKLDGARERLPVWSGEIYLEAHRGVQTTARELKSAFRAAERALQVEEAAAVVGGHGPIEAAPWERLVLAQFHDDIPGSSIGEVYSEHIPELHTLAAEALERTSAALPAGGSDCLFNPLVVEAVHVADDGARRLPSLSGVDPASLPAIEATAPRASGRSLTSGRVSLELDAHGHIESLTFDGRKVRIGPGFGRLEAFADRPVAFEAWDIDRATLDHPRALGGERPAVSFERTSSGTAEASVTVVHAIADGVSARTTYGVDAVRAVVHVTCEVTLDRDETLVKALFPTGYRSATTRFGAPFASAVRAQVPGHPDAEAAFEGPAARWASVCTDAGDEGLGVVAEASHGMGCLDGLLHLSLVRSARVTDTGLQPELRRDDAGPACFDRGTTTLRYALVPAGVGVAWDEQPGQLAESLFTRPIAYTGSPMAGPLSAVRCSPGVVVSWAKPAESGSGWVLRVHETLGRAGEVAIELTRDARVTPVSLLESPMGEATTGRTHTHAVRPNAFASLLVTGL